MGLISTEVLVGLGGPNAKRFEDLGYKIPRYYNENSYRMMVKKGTKILVNVGDLPNCSNAFVAVKCDCCKTIYENIE